mgnify:FL=1
MNRSKQDFSLIFLASHSLVTWTILAITTANIGIAIRQKWMFVPMIIIFLMIFIGEKRANNIQTDDGK